MCRVWLELQQKPGYIVRHYVSDPGDIFNFWSKLFDYQYILKRYISVEIFTS